jgi:hypothetical protein
MARRWVGPRGAVLAGLVGLVVVPVTLDNALGLGGFRVEWWIGSAIVGAVVFYAITRWAMAAVRR